MSVHMSRFYPLLTKLSDLCLELRPDLLVRDFGWDLLYQLVHAPVPSAQSRTIRQWSPAVVFPFRSEREMDAHRETAMSDTPNCIEEPRARNHQVCRSNYAELKRSLDALVHAQGHAHVI